MSDFILSEEEQQQVDEGEAADFLLDNPMFLLAIERIRKECSEGILTSRPEDHAVREQLYNLSRGLSAVTAELANMSSVATSILENAALQQPTEEQVAQDDPGDEASY